MIESMRTHPYTRAVCLETARLFEQRAARELIKAQYLADQGAQDLAREHQARARLAQQRASAWHVRARNAPPISDPSDYARAPHRFSKEPFKIDGATIHEKEENQIARAQPRSDT
jgi:hypothetical protein